MLLKRAVNSSIAVPNSKARVSCGPSWIVDSLSLCLAPLCRPHEKLRAENTGYIVVYGNLQAASTKLYKKKDGTGGQPTGASAYKWAAYCSLVPLITGM